MCGRVDELIRAWENTGQMSLGGLSLVSDHVRHCRRCDSVHRGLLPLLRRDASGSSGLLAVPGPLSEGFTERLMQRLAVAAPPGRSSRRPGSGRAPRVPFALAGGAVLLVAVGLLTWLWGLRSGGEEVWVSFELAAPGARNVNLVGDFNDWDPGQLAMKDVGGSGSWQITIPLKKGRVYTYNFLMDGRLWIADPRSPRQVQDGFGGTSSVLEL